MPKAKVPDTKEFPFLEDESILQEGERLLLRWVEVSKIPSLLWEDNPKLHSIDTLWESIQKFGFLDPAKWDINLTNKAGTKGAICYGNGRLEAVHWGWEAYRRGDYKGDVPRGIAVDNAGNWYIPIKFGIDAKSEAAAADFAIHHNNLTMLGGNFSDSDIWELYDKESLLKVGRLVLQDKDFEPLAMTGEEVDALLTFISGSPQKGKVGDSDKGSEGNGTKTVVCPHCGEEFIP